MIVFGRTGAEDPFSCSYGSVYGSIEWVSGMVLRTGIGTFCAMASATGASICLPNWIWSTVDSVGGNSLVIVGLLIWGAYFDSALLKSSWYGCSFIIGIKQNFGQILGQQYSPNETMANIEQIKTPLKWLKRAFSLV